VNRQYIETLRRGLPERGIQLARGLTEREICEGNPILAVMQTEVSVGAPELGWFFHDEFGAPEPAWKRPAVRTMEFWSGLGAK
jgi:hypothetical protein